MFCTNAYCFTLNSLDKLDSDIYHVVVQYRCRVCLTMSFQCLYCNDSNAKFYASRKQVERHITNCHNTDIDMNKSDDSNSYADDDDNVYDCNTNDDDSSTIDHIILDIVSDDFNQNKVVYQYIHLLVQFDTQVALTRLVTQSSFQTTDLSEQLLRSITPASVNLFLEYAILILQCGSTTRGVLSSVVTQLLHASNNNLVCNLHLPISIDNQRAMILDKHYVTSLSNTLPILKPMQQSNGDAFFDFYQFICYALCFATAPKADHWSFQLTSTPYAQQQIATNTHSTATTVLVQFWMDDWDANSSLQKLNKHSVFSCVCTIYIIDKVSCKLVGMYSNLLAVGKKQNSHTKFYDNVKHGIHTFHTTIQQRQHYCHVLRQATYVMPIIFLNICDQPARREALNLLRGNSNLHACFGYACHYTNFAKQFPACNDCVLALTQNQLIPLCHVCHNWTLPSTETSYQYKEPLLDLPQQALLPSVRQINTHGIPLTTTIIKAVWKECLDALNNNTITVNDAVAQLQLICLDASTIELFIDRWRNQKILSMIFDIDEHVDSQLQDNIEDMLLSTPSEFEDFCWSPALDWCSLEAWVETPMHIQSGVVKAVCGIVFHWAKERGHESTLLTFMNTALTSLRTYSNVRRLRLATYNAAMAGWVGDTCRSMCFLFPWIYQFLSENMFHFVPYTPPTTSFELWTKPICVQFLKSRGITPGNKRIAELKTIIGDMVDNNDGNLPEPVIPPACGVNGSDMLELVRNCHNLFKHFFAIHNNKQVTMSAVKHFLNVFHKIDRTLHPNSKPMYLTKYNFVSLIRAMGQLDGLTSMRFYHEGGLEGEGIVRILRPLLPTNLPVKFATHLLQNYTRQKLLHSMCGKPFDLNVFDNNDDDVVAYTTTKEQNYNDEYHVYDKLEYVQSLISANQPISIVIVRPLHQHNNIILIVIRTVNGIATYEIQLQNGSSNTSAFLLPLFNVIIVPTAMAGVCDKNALHDMFITSGFLLPCWSSNMLISSKYSLLTFDMQYLDCNGILK